MVLGALLRTICGAIVGLIVGVILSLFPSFSDAITNGIQTIIPGVDLSGKIVLLMTGLGFFFGLISAIVHELRK